MKKILVIYTFLIALVKSQAQTITFSSNGHINSFQKVDSMYFNEYAGRKPSTKSSNIDTVFSKSLIQFENSFGFISRSKEEANRIQSKITNPQKLLTTSFYRHADGTFQAPTNTLFFQPRNEVTVDGDFGKTGKVIQHKTFKSFYYLQLNTVFFSDGDKIFALCDSLFKTGLVSLVEPVFVRQIKMNSDPLLPNEWNIANTGQYNGIQGADMKVAGVWAQGISGAGTRVAVIDFGVDLNHPDLQPNLLPGYDATGNNSGGGPVYDANNTHGTECAGIIASLQNNIGGVGIAYNSKIIPIRIGIGDALGHFVASDYQASACLNFATTNGADIISNSWTWGGSTSVQIDQAILNAVKNGRGGKGSIVLFAVGNNNSSIQYPATNTNVIAVGASCECDTRKRSSSYEQLVAPGVSTDPLGTSCDNENLWGSNFGTGLDVIAPGVNITTTTLPNGNDYTNAYVNDFRGTSAAGPNVAGVLALILSVNPNLTGQQTRKLLESSTDKVGGYTYNSNVSGQPNGTWSIDAGYGRVNALTAACNALSTFIISGAPLICNTSTFAISNQPQGTSITWISSNANGLSINSSGLATRVNNFNGTVSVSATINNSGCGSVPIAPINIYVGTPYTNNGTLIYVNGNRGVNPISLNPAATYFFQSDPVQGNVTSYNWVLPKGFSFLSGNNTSSLYITTPSTSGNYTLYCSANNACGSSWLNSLGITVTTGGGGGASAIMVYPNPASSTLTVQITDSLSSNSQSTTLPQFYQLILMDRFSTKVFSVQSNAKTTAIPVGNLPSGIYYLNLIYKEDVLQRQIVISR